MIVLARVELFFSMYHKSAILFSRRVHPTRELAHLFSPRTECAKLGGLRMRSPLSDPGTLSRAVPLAVSSKT